MSSRPSGPFQVDSASRDDAGGTPLLAASLHWPGRDAMRATQALILCVGRGEALVLADDRPGRASGQPVALRLAWPAPAGWATARVVAARRTRMGPWELRLRFLGRPSPTFRTILGGDPARH
jgi:hypothetical protein